MTDRMVTCQSWCFAGVCVLASCFSVFSPVTDDKDHQVPLQTVQVPRQLDAKFTLLVGKSIAIPLFSEASPGCHQNLKMCAAFFSYGFCAFSYV